MPLRDFLARLIGTGPADGTETDRARFDPSAPSGRVSGPPPSGNGASSFHLLWEVPPVPLVEVEATIEVVEAPTVPRLYFWALQVDFQQGPSRRGGAHFGLQYHPGYPDGGAVNWGGYRAGGGELDGSLSDLPSALDNVNTRTYGWQPGHCYRYHIGPAPDQPEGEPNRRWRGSITDQTTGVETVVRDLFVEADHLIRPMVWSEVFADCDHPSVTVRWSDLRAVTADGETVTVDRVRLNYQTHRDGGCANTDTSVEESADRRGFLQRTSVERSHLSGDRLSLLD